MQKRFFLKVHFLNIFSNFIFVASQLNMHQAIHLNASKVLASLYSKWKVC